MEIEESSRPRLAVGVDAADLDALVDLAIDILPVGLLIVDDRGTIVFANREAESIFGFDAGRLAGELVETLLPSSTRAAHAAWRASYHAAPDVRRMGAGRHLLGRRKDGREFPVEVGLVPVRVRDRTFVLTSVLDISSVHEAEGASRRIFEERLAFEALVADIAAQFVNLPPEQMDTAVTSALQRVVEALGLDRAVVMLREGDGEDFSPVYGWARHGLIAVPAERLSLKERFPFAWATLMAGEVVSFADVSDIPDEVSRTSVIRFGATAGATLGFSLDGRIAGCVAFATAAGRREWPPGEIGRLELVTRILANAIARQRADKALATALAEVRRLSDRLSAENVYLREEFTRARGSVLVVGESPAILRSLDLVAQVAPTDSTVLLLGETGTGKEIFATHVHESSSRAGRLMVRVNCAAIPDTLLESELFGREKGAYTGALTRQIGRFELADKSTIFLDEIGDLPLDVQVKLLRVLEDQQVERLGSSRATKVDVRIVAATHRDLDKMVAAGRFREDLYYRLNVFPIKVPPLRERPGDIPLLVGRFVHEFSRRMGKPIGGIDKDCLAELQRYTWPGNVRELRNLVERAMITAKPGGRLVIPVVPVAHAADAGARTTRLVDVEVAHMQGVLESCGWRIRGAGGAAERLGLKPSTLETRMAKLGIRRPERS